jgi:hypothetical protein
MDQQYFDPTPWWTISISECLGIQLGLVFFVVNFSRLLQELNLFTVNFPAKFLQSD